MRGIRILCLFCISAILLIQSGCSKKKTETQAAQEYRPRTELDVIQFRESNSGRTDPLDVMIHASQTIGMTNINQAFREASDAYMSRIVSLDFTGDEVEHLGTIERVSKLKELAVGTNLTSVDTRALPRTLEKLDLRFNKIISLDTRGLPRTLELLNLKSSTITSLNTRTLPKTLKILILLETPLSGVFEVTPNMCNIFNLNAAGTKIEKVTGLENLTAGKSRMLFVNFLQSPIQNPEEFLKIKNVYRLAFSVPADYTDGEIKDLHDKIMEQNPGIESLFIERYVAGKEGRMLLYDDM